MYRTENIFSVYWLGCIMKNQASSQPASQPPAQVRPRSRRQEEQEQEQQDTNKVQFALVRNSFAQLSRASCRVFPG